MSNYIDTLRAIADRVLTQRRERVLLNPATIVASTFLGLALVAVPVTLGQRSTQDRVVNKEPSSAASRAVSAAAAGGRPEASTASVPATAAPQPAHDTLAVAFYGGWGDDGYRSLARNIEKIDVLMPMWYHIGNDGKLSLSNAKDKARVMRLIRERNPDLKVMPIVNNYDKRTQAWNPKQVGRLMRNKGKRQAIAKRIVKTMKAEGFAGVNMDLEGFTSKDRSAITAFMKELYPRANSAGMIVSQDVIVGSAAYNHAKLARYNDYMIPMMYDEHWKTSGHGPIASQAWYEKTLRKFTRQVPAEKVIVGLGTYAYNWAPGKRAKAMTFSEVKSLAHSKGKTIKLGASGMNSHFWYKQGGKKRHVWMLDAVSSYNQVKAASELDVAGYAFWRIGAEDPGLWNVLDDRDELGPETAAQLETSKRKVAYDAGSGLIESALIVP